MPALPPVYVLVNFADDASCKGTLKPACIRRHGRHDGQRPCAPRHCVTKHLARHNNRPGASVRHRVHMQDIHTSYPGNMTIINSDADRCETRPPHSASTHVHKHRHLAPCTYSLLSNDTCASQHHSRSVHGRDIWHVLQSERAARMATEAGSGELLADSPQRCILDSLRQKHRAL